MVLVLTAACQKSEREPAPAAAGSAAAGTGAGSAYVRDLDRMCRVEEYSAKEEPGADPLYATAVWLDKHLETREARAFLIRFNRTDPSLKAGLLDAELARLGVTGPCPTARRWDPQKE